MTVWPVLAQKLTITPCVKRTITKAASHQATQARPGLEFSTQCSAPTTMTCCHTRLAPHKQRTTLLPHTRPKFKWQRFSTGRPWQLSAINHYHKQAWYKISSPFREGVCKWVPSLPVRLRWWQSTPQLDRVYDASAGGTLCICSVVWGASSIASSFEWSGWQC